MTKNTLIQAAVISTVIFVSHIMPTTAMAAPDNLPEGRTSSAIADGQYPASYFPNTELLGADEMRITALGTGMPNQTKKAVSISYLVELGNGDKFLFDMGMGSMGNLFSLRPDFSKLDKVFASHLHIDHVGDFMGLHIGGWLSGRYDPIHFYGPSGSKPELGSKAFIEGMIRLTLGISRPAPVRCLTEVRRSWYMNLTSNRKMKSSIKRMV